MNDKEALTIIRNYFFAEYKDMSSAADKRALDFIKAVDYIVSHNYDPAITTEAWGNLSKEIWAVSQAIERDSKEVYNGDDDQ